MHMFLRNTAMAVCLFGAGMARADVPQVVTDIAPVHSLVAQVMRGVGEPDLILPQNASPHGYALRPSQAGSVSNANLIIWIGPLLTPWLGRARDSLAPDTAQIVLMDVAGAQLLESRSLAVFADDDDHDHDDHEDHADHDKHDGHDDHEDHADHDKHDGHDDHEDHADHDKHDDHDDHAGHDDHDKHDDHDDHAGHDDHEGHNHGDGPDPHAWLDPQNAKVWVTAIAEALSAQDPENADKYRANAAAAQTDLEALQSAMTEQLAPYHDLGFLVYHDAFQYLEARFDLNVLGAIAASDAQSPSAARLAELRDAVRDQEITCVFAEPQYSTKLVTALQDGTDLRQAELDPLGGKVAAGPDFYAGMMNAISKQIATCLN